MRPYQCNQVLSRVWGVYAGTLKTEDSWSASTDPDIPRELLEIVRTVVGADSLPVNGVIART